MRITLVRPLTLSLIACAVSTPVDPRWSTARSLPEPIQEMHAAVLDGTVYIAGGFDRSGQPTARAYRYDPTSDTWERIADLPRRAHIAAAVPTIRYTRWAAFRLSYALEGTCSVHGTKQWRPRAAANAARSIGRVPVKGN